MNTDALAAAVSAALNAAEPFCGATAPNPPVGAAALDASGGLLGAGAHERAGRAHAESGLLESLKVLGLLSKVHTVLVTLEPCNHTGRTPPCTEALIRAGVKQVAYLVPDPNPVAAGGEARLRSAGIEVIGPGALAGLLSGEQRLQLHLQLGPFIKRVRTGLPWVTVKRAFNLEGSMLPPQGSKTFTSPGSLRLAHVLRRRADAILTASGTVLADQPSFTVRHVPDHAGKIRALWIADRRKRVSDTFLHDALARGLMAERVDDWRSALAEAGRMGALEVLVEAGPEFSAVVLASDAWDRCVDFRVRAGLADHVEDRLRDLTTAAAK